MHSLMTDGSLTNKILLPNWKPWRKKPWVNFVFIALPSLRNASLNLDNKNIGQNNLVCSTCCQVYLRSDFKVCPKCNYDPCHTSPDHDPYYRTESRVAGVKSNVVIGEPCLVNPNSRDSVKTVLKHIRTMSGIPEQRKWVIVWSDGVPYVHMTDLIESIYTCSKCGTEIDTKGMSFHEHVSECYPDIEGSFKRVFDCIISKPGPGHIEINMAKVLLDVGWMPVISRFCSLLGFPFLKGTTSSKDWIQPPQEQIYSILCFAGHDVWTAPSLCQNVSKPKSTPKQQRLLHLDFCKSPWSDVYVSFWLYIYILAGFPLVQWSHSKEPPLQNAGSPCSLCPFILHKTASHIKSCT